MKNLIKLMRIKHYLKNGLVFLPLFFSGKIFDDFLLVRSLIGFIAFSLMASAIYVLNDLKDIEEDRQHVTRKNRPLASGKVSKTTAFLFLLIMMAASLAISVSLTGLNGWALSVLLLYFGINVLYSYGFKDLAIMDILILVTGFLLRIIYGSLITGIGVSDWLYLMVMAIAFYMGLGKRKNEMAHQGTNSRKVLKHYTKNFLDNNMHLFITLAIGFYALWCIDPLTTLSHHNFHMIWTMPLICVIILRYDLDVETNMSGDPVEIILKDRLLIFLAVVFLVTMGLIIY